MLLAVNTILIYIQGQCGKQHLNTSFSASRINRLGKAAYANKAQVSAVHGSRDSPS